ncbi:Complement decay-accelerating factor transmembrane isoform [Oryzias melastigma]|uniref:Complement decay-accelerating factor transmembrane isoform n=1 Tax=Oryzias melastigma TaxID=30732 RepID=A0A834CLT4_ORYME|nr:Complement decay-accelerating factor transmembrane isoform [Oryzias melastigma]
MFNHCTFSNFYLVLFLYQICVQYSFVFVVVVCKSPPEVANSVRSWNGGDIPKYGEIIHYSCEEGYALIGNSIITCDEHGGYTPRPPICETIPTEAKIPTTMTSSIPSTSKAETTSTVSSTTSHRNKFATTQAASTVSLSQEADSGSWKAFEETVTSSTSSFRVSAPLIISLGAVSLVTILLMVFLYILHQKKKGSYDTGEDLKPELLQFQNL